jgi:hypothetical protein
VLTQFVDLYGVARGKLVSLAARVG